MKNCMESEMSCMYKMKEKKRVIRSKLKSILQIADCTCREMLIIENPKKSLFKSGGDEAGVRDGV